MDWQALLVSAPAALFLVMGVIIAKKYLSRPKPCPAEPVLDAHKNLMVQQTESLKSLCVSVDKNSESIKEMVKMHNQVVVDLVKTLKENGNG
jgi:hypothetical protein